MVSVRPKLGCSSRIFLGNVEDILHTGHLKWPLRTSGGNNNNNSDNSSNNYRAHIDSNNNN